MSLETAIDQIIVTHKEHVAVCLYHTNELIYAHREHVQFPSASLIKLAILGTALNSKEDLTQLLTVSNDEAVGGSGVLQQLQSRQYSLADILGLMIADSDNFATNLIIDHLSIPQINDWIHEQGYQETYLGRRLMDLDASRHGLENLISAFDAVGMLGNILDGHPETHKWFLNQQFRYKLPLLFDEISDDVLVMNKTGEDAMIDHDVARFVKGDDWFDVAVLTNGISNRIDTISLMAQIGKEIYKSL